LIEEKELLEISVNSIIFAHSSQRLWDIMIFSSNSIFQVWLGTFVQLGLLQVFILMIII